MNLPLYIAKRFHYDHEGTRSMSRPAVRIAIIGMALGLATMLITISVVVGFKSKVRDQIVGFGSHIRVYAYSNGNNNDETPIIINDSLENKLKTIPGVKCVQHIATKPGILKTKNDFQGIILKGVDSTFDWQFFKSNLVAGDTLTWQPDAPSKKAIISSSIAKMLHLKLGDSFLTYFVKNDIRVRKFVIGGIYQTNFSEYDKLYILTDIRHIQSLNKWDSTQIGSLELLVNNYNNLDLIGNEVYATVSNRFDADSTVYMSSTIKEQEPQMFGWFKLLDVNGVVIIILMLLVSGFIMVSGLLILILERTNTIGVLKALGADNWLIRKIFLWHAFFIIVKGMAWGNIVGLIIIFLQSYFHIIPLDPAVYYMNYVPMVLSPFAWLWINVGTAVLSVFMLIGPSYIITRIVPAKAIKFE